MNDVEASVAGSFNQTVAQNDLDSKSMEDTISRLDMPEHRIAPRKC